jgi:hypothetical protein
MGTLNLLGHHLSPPSIKRPLQTIDCSGRLTTATFSDPDEEPTMAIEQTVVDVCEPHRFHLAHHPDKTSFTLKRSVGSRFGANAPTQR